MLGRRFLALTGRLSGEVAVYALKAGRMKRQWRSSWPEWGRAGANLSQSWFTGLWLLPHLP